MVRVVTISLLSVLSLWPAGILSAKECKGQFHFDLTDKVDNRETFSHRRATSLEECVRICYSRSDFCFSALFIPSPTGSHQCLLSYQTAYMCSRRQLSTVHKLSDKPVIVECIRCTALGDKVLPVRPLEEEAFHKDGLIKVTDGILAQRVETSTPAPSLQAESEFETGPYARVPQNRTKIPEQQLKLMTTSEEQATTNDVMASLTSTTAHVASTDLEGEQRFGYSRGIVESVSMLEQSEVTTARTVETTSERWHSTLETLLVTLPAEAEDVHLPDQISTEGQPLSTRTITTESETAHELISTTTELPQTVDISITPIVSSTTTESPEGDTTTSGHTPFDVLPLVTVHVANETTTGRRRTTEFSPTLTPFAIESTEGDQEKKLENILMNEMEFAISGPSEIKTLSSPTSAEAELSSAQRSTEGASEENEISKTTIGVSGNVSEGVISSVPHLTESAFSAETIEPTADELNRTATEKKVEITDGDQEGKVTEDEEEQERKTLMPGSSGEVETGAVTYEGDGQESKASTPEITEKIETLLPTSSDYDHGTTAAFPTATTHIVPVKFEKLNYTGGISEYSGYREEETVPLVDFFLPEHETFNGTSRGAGMTFAESIERSLAFELDKGQSTLSSGFMETTDQPIEINEQDEVESTPAQILIDSEPAKDSDSQQSATTLVGQEETVADNGLTTSKMCQENISFLSNPASSQSGIVYGFETAANSTEQCAQLCYGKQCSSGVFIKPVLVGQSGSCLMAFGEEVCDQSKQRVTSYSGPFPVEISCIRCDSFVVDQKPKVIKKTEYGETEEEKVGLESSHMATKAFQESENATIPRRICLLNISFEIVEPSFHSKSDFVSHKFATSVAECAKLCYETGCTVAGFTRANVDGEPSFCLLSFKSDTCSGSTRYTQAEPTKEPIQIQCIRCDVMGFERIRQRPNESATEVHTTSQKSDDEVIEVPIRNDEKKKGCTDTICQRVNMATASSEQFSTVAQIMVASGKRNCTNRITFQAFQPAENYNVAFTSDHRSSSAADCAKQCYNEGNCQVSAFIAPPKGLSAGVCLLSEEPGFCKTNSEKLVEHSSISPFVISCIACSRCSFNIRNYIPSVPTARPATWDSYFDDFEMQVDAKNALECAEKCYSKKCTLAAYSPLTPNGNCLMTIKATRKCDGDNSDPNVDTSGTLPLLIDCVECSQ